MSELYAVARPYAQAAFNQALESASIDKWTIALEKLAIAVNDEQLAAILSNPSIQKQQVLDLLVDIVSDTDLFIKNFILLLAEYNRLPLASIIFELYKTFKMDHEKIVDAHVFSPFKLEAAQLDRLRHALAKKLNHEVICHEHLDQSLISGVVVRVGDTVINHSIRDKINRFKAHLNLKEAVCHQ